MKKEEKKKKTSKTAWGCLTFIIFIIVSSIIFVPMLKEQYDKMEKELNKESFDKIVTFFNNTGEYQDLSDTQKKTLAVKLFLLNRCKGGDETLKKLIKSEQNISYDACLIVQNNKIIKIIDSFGPVTPEQVKTMHIRILKIDFKGAVKLYDWYITE